MTNYRKQKLVDLELKVRAETNLAWGVEDGTEEGPPEDRRLTVFWLPKSQVEKAEEGGKVIFTMPEWLAVDKGLI